MQTRIVSVQEITVRGSPKNRAPILMVSGSIVRRILQDTHGPFRNRWLMCNQRSGAGPHNNCSALRRAFRNALGLRNIRISPAKRAFYEQVTTVKVLLAFFFIGCCFCRWLCCAACCSPPGFYAHSDELIWVQARCRLGFERRVDAAISRSALKAKARSQSSEPRCRRNG
jgi:hypothetical protein